MLIAEGILQEHPVAVTLGQYVMAVVAIISFAWAYRITKPGRPKKDATDLRQSTVEAVVGLRALCNPGRRLTDRCSMCPMDTRCIKGLAPPGTSEDGA